MKKLLLALCLLYGCHDDAEKKSTCMDPVEHYVYEYCGIHDDITYHWQMCKIDNGTPYGYYYYYQGVSYMTIQEFYAVICPEKRLTD
jgi:hypothetical protein